MGLGGVEIRDVFGLSWSYKGLVGNMGICYMWFI